MRTIATIIALAIAIPVVVTAWLVDEGTEPEDHLYAGPAGKSRMNRWAILFLLGTALIVAWLLFTTEGP
jgi:hypothetical protein